MRRVIREREPDPQVTYESTITVEVTIVQAAALVYDRVVIPEPTRQRELHFALRQHQHLDDLPDWPRARADTEALGLEVLAALGAALAECGLQPLPSPDGAG
jgi:hypothetical protein